MDSNLLIAQDEPSLLTLPQEVLDMIFGLAYPRQTKLAIVDKRYWQDLNEDSDDDSLNGVVDRRRPPYPGPLVDAFMVSKVYFVNAARVFIANQQVVRSSRYFSSFPKMFETPGIVTAYAKEFNVDMYEAGSLRHCRSLQTVSMKFHVWNFSALKPWKHHISERQFMDWSLISNILLIRGVTYLALHIDPHQHANSDVRKEIWSGNMKRLESLIRAHVLQPMRHERQSKPTADKSVWIPLYEGSKVSLTSSELQGGTHVMPELKAHKMTCEDSAITMGAYTRMMSLKGKTLRDDDMPDSASDMQALLSIDPQAVTNWVAGVKANRKAVRDLMQ